MVVSGGGVVFSGWGTWASWSGLVLAHIAQGSSGGGSRVSRSISSVQNGAAAAMDMADYSEALDPAYTTLEFENMQVLAMGAGESHVCGYCSSR